MLQREDPTDSTIAVYGFGLYFVLKPKRIQLQVKKYF